MYVSDSFSKGASDSVDKKLETVRTLITALQSGDMDLAIRTTSDAFVVSGLAPRLLNRDEFLAVQSELLNSMPDFSYNLAHEQVVHKGVRALIQITGTHQQDLALPMFGLQTIQTTGIFVVLPQVNVIFRVEDKSVIAMEVEQVPGGGLTGLLQQIGTELPLVPRRDMMEDPTAYQSGAENPLPPDIDT